jgi:hypothetical protein
VAEVEAAVGGGGRERPEDGDVRDGDDQQAPEERLLAQPGGLVLQLVQPGAARDEALHHPVRQAEQAQLLGRGRIHGQAVGVFGVALGPAHLVRVAVVPDRALAQQPVRGEPGSGQHHRRPPREREEDGGGAEAGHGQHQPARDEVHVDVHRRTRHAEVEVAGDGEVAGELRILEMSQAGGPDAGLDEAVVEPGRDAAPQVRAHGLVDRGRHLQQNEDDAYDGEGRGQSFAPLHGADERPHRDGEAGGEHAAQDQRRPPDDRERAVRAGQDGEELPLLAVA